MNNLSYKQKYIKYKLKYCKLKNKLNIQSGGSSPLYNYDSVDNKLIIENQNFKLLNETFLINLYKTHNFTTLEFNNCTSLTTLPLIIGTIALR